MKITYFLVKISTLLLTTLSTRNINVDDSLQEMFLTLSESFTEEQQPVLPTNMIYVGKALTTNTVNSSFPSNTSHFRYSERTFEGAVAASASILLGGYTTFAGQKRFKVVLFIMGFSMAGYGSLITLQVLNKRGTFQRNQNDIHWIYIMSITGASLLGGLLFISLSSFAAYLISTSLGMLIAIFILELDSFSSWNSALRLSFMFAMSISTMIFGRFASEPSLIISTSFFGSFCVFIGIDYYLQSGFSRVLDLSFQTKVTSVSTGSMLFFTGFLILGSCGAIVQFIDLRKRSVDSDLPPQHLGKVYSPLQEEAKLIEKKYKFVP